MDRRIKNYKNVIDEPPLTDYEINEGWYSLDEYRMMTEGTGNLTGGSCGTRYQIVIKGTVNLLKVDRRYPYDINTLIPFENTSRFGH